MDELVKGIRETLSSYPANVTLSTTTFRLPFTSRFFTVKDTLSLALDPMLAFARDRNSLITSLEPAFQPPVALEKKFGFSGLSGKYNLPGDLTYNDLQNYVFILSHKEMRGQLSTAQCVGRMSELSAGLIARNPSLQNLRYDMEEGLTHRDIVLGVASRFKAPDIQYYLDNRLNLSNQLDNVALETKIESRLGVNTIGWRPSMETLRSIDQQISARPAAAATLKSSSPSRKATAPKMGR